MAVFFDCIMNSIYFCAFKMFHVKHFTYLDYRVDSTQFCIEDFYRSIYSLAFMKTIVTKLSPFSVKMSIFVLFLWINCWYCL